MPRSALISSSCLLACLMSALFLVAPASAEPPPARKGVRLLEAWPDLEFKEPIEVVSPRDGTDDLFVVEKYGRIKTLPKWRGVGPVTKPRTFLDLTSQVAAQAQGGVLGLAFHPRYRETRRLYVSYLAKNPVYKGPRAAQTAERLQFRLVVAEFRTSGTDVIAGSQRMVLQILKRFPIHQAGGVGFGPDGMLYISTGDGGSKNDKDGEAQNRQGWLGKILRIDVDGRTGQLGYAIPADNPFAGKPADGLPEIWGYGFRNPWRFAWGLDGRMWTTEPGTTGPESREWVTEVLRAGNHGWPFYEGTRPIQPLPPTIDPGTLVPRAFEYVRGPGDGGTAGVAGVIYQGQRLPALQGRYVFGDYMRGQVYSLALEGPAGRARGTNWDLLAYVSDLASIGTDAQGELYFASFQDGLIFTLAPE